MIIIIYVKSIVILIERGVVGGGKVIGAEGVEDDDGESTATTHSFICRRC